MQGVGVEDWRSIFIFVFGVHGRITGAGAGGGNFRIGLRRAAVCMMLFVYDRFSWIIMAFRARPVPAGQLGGDKKLLLWTIPIEPSRRVEGLTEIAPSTWDSGGGEVFVTVMSLETNRHVHRSGLPTDLGITVVECISCTVLFGTHHHGRDRGPSSTGSMSIGKGFSPQCRR